MTAPHPLIMKEKFYHNLPLITHLQLMSSIYEGAHDDKECGNEHVINERGIICALAELYLAQANNHW